MAWAYIHTPLHKQLHLNIRVALADIQSALQGQDSLPELFKSVLIGSLAADKVPEPLLKLCFRELCLSKLPGKKSRAWSR